MIVYFCAEYHLHDNFASYAGGLGILAGDTLRQMGDMGQEFVGIGLYYYKGYLQDESYWQSPQSVGLAKLKDATGQDVHIKILVEDQVVVMAVWVYEYKSAKVYLLDCNIPANKPEWQQVSHRLYDSQIDIRLNQELVLGLGGAKLVKALGITPSVYHLNESHCAFMFLEKLPHVPILFTNHTIVPEGNHMYELELVTRKLKYYMASGTVSLSSLGHLGSCQYPGVFSMTSLALNICLKSNGVSGLHTRKLMHLYPNNNCIVNVTNGVHVPTWSDIQCRPDRLATGIVSLHEAHKRRLIEYVSKRTGSVIDPKSLIVTWARRIVGYKRPFEIFKNQQNLDKVLDNGVCNVVFLISGKPHPTDLESIEILEKIKSLSITKYKDKVIFLPEYCTQIAKLLVAGSDIWLNTPIVGFEACGTSGMKSALNGVLQLTTKDGWLDEVDISRIGYELDSNDLSRSFFDIMIHRVIPDYHAHTKSQPEMSAWLSAMNNCRQLIIDRFSAATMVTNYLALYRDLNK